MRAKPFKVISVESADFVTVAAPMSVVRLRQRTVTQSRLIPWDFGVPGIWFRYADGYEVVADARIKTPDVIEAISRLGWADRAQLDKLLAEGTHPRTRESTTMATIFRPSPKWDSSA